MFTVTCPSRGRVLMSESSIVRLRNDAEGIALTVRCYCGEQHTVSTGRARRSAPVPALD